MLLPTLVISLIISLALAQSTVLSAIPTAGVNSSSSATRSSFVVPFFSAPNTFTPTATGNTAVPGVVVTLVNTAGAGGLPDTFIYTKAAATVAPTGNVTIAPTGAAASVNNLKPDPTNLQTAGARRMSSVGGMTTATVLSGAMVVGLSFVGGMSLFL